MTTTGEVQALLARSALAQGEADELEARAIAAARQGNHLVAWGLEQRAGRLLAEARALALKARELLDRQRVAAGVVRQACDLCAAALGEG